MVASKRRFRFSAQIWSAPSLTAFAERLRRFEAAGYSSVWMTDHFYANFAPVPALAAAAAVTSTLRIGTLVFSNDYRHPALLAKEAATIDVLSDGRLELGLGAGWDKHEYASVGIPFDSGATRVSRLEEAVQIIKGLWTHDSYSFEGEHYTIQELENYPRPVQSPHPPFVMGGGGRRMLSLAARQADVVGLHPKTLPNGRLDTGEETEAALERKLGWVREAAGKRFDGIELNNLIWYVGISDRPQDAAEEIARQAWHWPDATAEAVLRSPHMLVGSVDSVVERLIALRERFQISHIAVMQDDAEAFAPVVARLSGM